MKHKTEADYQAESDAHTLITAEQIKTTPGRMRMAKVAARKIATDAAKAAKTAGKVASKPKPKVRSPRKRR